MARVVWCEVGMRSLELMSGTTSSRWFFGSWYEVVALSHTEERERGEGVTARESQLELQEERREISILKVTKDQLKTGLITVEGQFLIYCYLCVSCSN